MAAPAHRLSNTVQVRRLSYALGAEVLDFDIGADHGDETIAAVRQHWIDHKFILFRKQSLKPGQLIAFTKRFGALAYVKGFDTALHPGHPEIFMISNLKVNGERSVSANAAREWHSDTTYLERPHLGAILYCLERPALGGDTMFTNLEMAFSALSPTLQTVLAGLKADHGFRYYGAKSEEYRGKIDDKELKTHTSVAHPVVRTHDESGRKSLYVNATFTERFTGMTDEESRPLLQYLFQHLSQPAFTYRHRWEPGDALFWDNRSTQHFAPKDYDVTSMDAPENRRHMWRTTLLGGVPQ